MDGITIPPDAWRYTSAQNTTYNLHRISLSEERLNAFMEYVKTSERLARFSDAIGHGEARAAKRGGLSEAIGVMDLEAIYQGQDGRCFYCHDELGEDCETDHKKAISRGGANALSNIVLSCMSCNRSKRTKTPREFREWKMRRDQPTLFTESA